MKKKTYKCSTVSTRRRGRLSARQPAEPPDLLYDSFTLLAVCFIVVNVSNEYVKRSMMGKISCDAINKYSTAATVEPLWYRYRHPQRARIAKWLRCDHSSDWNASKTSALPLHINSCDRDSTTFRYAKIVTTNNLQNPSIANPWDTNYCRYFGNRNKSKGNKS